MNVTINTFDKILMSFEDDCSAIKEAYFQFKKEYEEHKIEDRLNDALEKFKEIKKEYPKDSKQYNKKIKKVQKQISRWAEYKKALESLETSFNELCILETSISSCSNLIEARESWKGEIEKFKPVIILGSIFKLTKDLKYYNGILEGLEKIIEKSCEI